MGIEENFADKSDFIIFFHKNELVKHSLPMEAVLELLYTQNHIALNIVATLSPFVSELTTVAIMAIYDPLVYKHDAILRQQKVNSSDLGIMHACSVQTGDCCVGGAYTGSLSAS